MAVAMAELMVVQSACWKAGYWELEWVFRLAAPKADLMAVQSVDPMGASRAG